MVTNCDCLQMKRANVTLKSGRVGASPKRISQTAWIVGDDKVYTERISRRVSHITGFDMETAEDLQISSYGTGGFYVHHQDFYPDGHPEMYQARGNRIATWMFYGSDVELGGATVFLHGNVTVFPKKGSAVFWHNLHRNGSNDYRTMHAGCPVLVGSKWGEEKNWAWLVDHRHNHYKWSISFF